MKTAGKIFEVYSKYKISVLLLLIGIPVISKLDVFSQTMLGKIVDNISDEDLWVSAAGIYTAAVAILFAVKQGYAIVEQRLSFKVTYDLRDAIAKKVLHMNSESLDQYSSDDIMQMWNEDVRDIQTISVQSIFDFLILTISAAMALIELGRISVYFPMIALGVNILAMIPVKILGRNNKSKSQNKRKSQVAMNEKFYTILNAIRLVKNFGKEEKEIQEFEKLNYKFVDDKLSFSVSSRIYKSVVNAVNAIAPTVILLIANFQIRDGYMSIGDIVLATSLLETISKPFSKGGNVLVELKGIGFKFDHLFKFLEQENEQSTGKSLVLSEPCSVEFRNVSYKVNESSIVDNISFSVGSGEKVAIVGESGSGKTTLNNLLLGLYSPTAGEILIENSNVGDLNLQSYRGNIHYSQSNTYAANASIMENLTLLGAKEDQCIQAAKEIQFHDEICMMPEGYHTIVDASGANISGGQKKKMAIIRALTDQKPIYVFDEITRGIDEKTASGITEYLVKSIPATVIFTMHNFYSIEYMDKIIVMQSGKIIAQGKHADLYQHCSYYRELFDNRKRTGNG